MVNSWNYDRAKEQIGNRIDEVKKVDIVDYAREMSLQNIPTNKAYRMDAVHLYVDILNLGDMLGSTDTEGETCHKRTLKFLDLHYRAVTRILAGSEAIRVDFHNQRLHGVVAKPYGADDEKSRVNRGVAIAKLIIDVLAETGDYDDKIANAKVRVGIDTGRSLVVNNGRAGHREPLFLGTPANIAAKLSSHALMEGVFLSNRARKAIGINQLADGKQFTTALTKSEIEKCQADAVIGVTKDKIVKEWREDNKVNPIGKFEFSRATPPLRDLDVSKLTPANSRRMETTSIYADIDGFTKYVSDHIEKSPEDVVRCLHVIRAELERVVTSDFDGRRIRFIGDCVHAHVLEGTSQTTDAEKTVTTATLCAGGLRSSFNLALERLIANKVDVAGLGLAIGFEYGPTTITRLGVHGDRVRCSVSRSVIASEAEQKLCAGNESSIGAAAYGVASEGVKKLFGAKRKLADLDYDTAVEALSADGDKQAKSELATAYIVSSPAMARAIEQPLRPHAIQRRKVRWL